MKRTILAGAAVLALAMCAGAAQARDSWSVSIGVPGVALGYGQGWHGRSWGYAAAAPIYYGPAPYYYYPAPTYVEPPPRVVYEAPVVEYAPPACPPGYSPEREYGRAGWVCVRPY